MNIERTKEDLAKYLECIGIKDSDIALISGIIDNCKPDEWTKDRIELANKMTEFATKLARADLFYTSEIVEMKRLMGTVFKPKTDSTLKIINDMQNDVINRKRREFKHHMTRLDTMENATRGFDQGFYLFSADPNIGKTALLIHLTVNLLRNNPELKVVLVTPDDTIKKVIRRFVANLTFQVSDFNPAFATKIDYADSGISDYNHSLREATTDPLKENLKLGAYEHLQKWTTNKRLTIVAKSKITLDDLESIVDEVGDCVLMVDACYKIKVNAKSYDKDVERAEGLKSISTEKDITLIGIKDSRKGQTRGSTNKANGDKVSSPIGSGDLKGDASWGYEADFIGTMWRDGQDVVFSIEKNKISSWTGISRLIFYKDFNAIVES